MKPGISIFAAVIVSLLMGCGSSHDVGTGSPVLGDKFPRIQKGILQPKCVSCHSPNQKGGGIDLATYQSILDSLTVLPGNANGSKLLQSVKSGRMPRGAPALSADEIRLMSEWIDEGAKERDAEVSPPVVQDLKPAFSVLSKTVFEPKCVVCHNAVKSRGKVDLSSYDGLMKSAGNEMKPIVLAGDIETSGLLVEVSQKKMPPTPKTFSNDEIKAIKDWILLGAPEVTPGIILPGPGEPAGPPQPTYEWLSKNIFTRRCGSCHGIPFKVGGIDFTSYATLVASSGKMIKALVPGEPEASGIYETIVSKKMPPERKQVSTQEVDLLRTWIKNGAKND